MTFFLVPEIFDTVDIDGSAGIYAMVFKMPVPKVMSKISRTAGNAVIDYDFGEDADLLPMPFSIRFYFEGSTTAVLVSKIDSLFTIPSAGGRIGVTGEFYATKLGTATQYVCTAQMQEPNYSLVGGVIGPNTTKVSNIPVTFIPTDLFEVVV